MPADEELLVRIAQVIDGAAFDLRREDRTLCGPGARDGSKRRRIALAKATRILDLVRKP